MLMEQIKQQINVFQENSEKEERGNKAAGKRARKATTALEKMFKQYRRESIERSKTK